MLKKEVNSNATIKNPANSFLFFIVSP